MPIAIARPDLEIVLVERRERRVHFLRHVVRTLGLSCEVRRAAIEAVPEGLLFDVVLMRGVAPTRKALSMAGRWAAVGGEVWLWTREAALEESEEVASIPLGTGGRIARLRPRDVPGP
jgi:16S rRNA G527 N7-methylase RsmG